MGTEFFPRLGAYCHDSSCGTLDFLPFTCDACDQTFCLEHRVYQAHRCPLGGHKDVTVTICPYCSSSVRTQWGEDVNETLELHRRTVCDPSKLETASRRMKCPVRACRESLTLSNRVRCRDCQRDVCLKHRFGSDHSCSAPQNMHHKKDHGLRSLISSKFLLSLSTRMGAECGPAAVSAVSFDSGNQFRGSNGNNTSVEAQ